MNKIINLTLIAFLFISTSQLESCKKDKSLAVLSTTSVSDITINSVISGGTITNGGGADITYRGVCWSTSPNPVVMASHTSDGKGAGSFISQITGLDPDTKYYIRAYATNSVGTGYGNEVSFTTTAIVLPTLTTSEVTSPTLTSGVSGGTISSDGGGAITAKGVCWSTTADPTTGDSITDEGPGTSNFISHLSGLTPGTTYFVRAYATNSAGTAYGNEVSFTTTALSAPSISTIEISSITLTTAVSGGTISSDGGANITAKGVCWSTTPDPTISSSKTDEGPGSSSFSSTITNLTAGTTYYVRAYATNSIGTGYGESVSFPTNPVEFPTLTTTIASSITQISATAGGTITSDGGGAIIAKGLCWSTSHDPTVALTSKTNEGGGTAAFSSNMINLQAGTTYYYRAYATNSAGTEYGSEQSFITDPVTIPSVTTVTASSITQTTAVSGGTISFNGGGTITAKGVCWSPSPGPTVALATKTNEGTGSGAFSSNITNLQAGVTYYYRAYATNSAGTAYGEELTFDAGPVVMATLTTTAVSSINTTTAVSGGTITSNGGGTITQQGICWSTNTMPTTGDFTATGTGTPTYTSNLSSLQQGSTYYVRAYAVNEAGTAYGNQVTFNTKLSDVEGNTYNVVVIGNQMWMAENLKTTSYNDNTTIPLVENNGAWVALSSPGYCWYNNDINNKNIYGAIYNWFVVNTGKLCPSGWHVPTDDEFKTLETHLGMAADQLDVWGWRGTDQGSQMKNTTGWAAGQNGTNTSGFSALPGGYRYGLSGNYNDSGNLSYWWSSTQETADLAWYRRLDGTNADIYRASVDKRGGKYVRCMKN
jgi:uncharacterized protein (TIGR02145 family)